MSEMDMTATASDERSGFDRRDIGRLGVAALAAGAALGGMSSPAEAQTITDADISISR